MENQKESIAQEATGPAQEPQAEPTPPSQVITLPPVARPAVAIGSAPIRGAGDRIYSPPPMKLLLKLADIMADLNWVEKRGHNTFFNYDYATESDILAAIRPRLAAKKIFVQTIVVKEEKSKTGKQTKSNLDIMQHRVELLHVFHDAESGEYMEVIGIGYSEDDGDKGFYKAYTGAVKYAFAKTFLVSTGDDPEEAGTPEEREAAKKAKKEKAGAQGGSRGPQRNGGADLPAEGVIFTVDGPVGEWSKGATKDGKSRYIFKLGPAIGEASTIDEKLAQGLIREADSGLRFRWKLMRSGSFINLKGADVIPPGDPA